MKSIPKASPPVLAWIVVLLLSVGLNLYLLVGPARPAQPNPAPTASLARLASAPADDDDDTNEEDDASWVALSEELRQTRRRLAECQGHAAPVNHQIVSQ